MKYLENHIINWTWFIGVPDDWTPNATEVEILLYDRKRVDDNTRPIGCLAARPIEEGDRIVTRIQLADGRLYPVKNPQHVFSYPKFP